MTPTNNTDIVPAADLAARINMSTDANKTNRSLLLTVAQVAQLLQVSSRTVWRLASTGELPHISIGRSKRWERRAVESYITNKTQLVACKGRKCVV